MFAQYCEVTLTSEVLGNSHGTYMKFDLVIFADNSIGEKLLKVFSSVLR